MVDPDFLKDVPLFHSLAIADLERLAGIMKEERLAAGAVLFEVGAPGSTMYVIKKGGIRISVPDRTGADVALATLGTGEFFGEMALLDGQPRSARASAIEDTELYSLSREDFLSFIGTRPQTALAMLSATSKRLRHTDQLMRQRAAYDVNAELDKSATFGERVADRLAHLAGSWTFVIVYVIAVVSWISIQLWIEARGGKPLDGFPFEFLGFLLGVLASLQAPVIIMAQNRDAQRDRFRADADYKVNLKNEVGIEKAVERIEELKRVIGEVRRQAKENELTIQRFVESIGLRLAELAARAPEAAPKAAAPAREDTPPPMPAVRKAQLAVEEVPAPADAGAGPVPRRWARGVGKPK